MLNFIFTLSLLQDAARDDSKHENKAHKDEYGHSAMQ